MNKTLRGGVAAGAASLLLLGGAGTYALWSDSVSLDGGRIQSGHLAFSDVVAQPFWQDVKPGVTTSISDIRSHRIVPGDVVAVIYSVKVSAEGDNLRAVPRVDLSQVTGDEALAEDISRSTMISTMVQRGSGFVDIREITEADDGATVNAIVRFTFDESSLNETQLQSLDMSRLGLTLEQLPR